MPFVVLNPSTEPPPHARGVTLEGTIVMKTSLDAQKRAEAALAGIMVIRVLELVDATMSHQDFAKEVGLMGHAEKWHPWYRQQVVQTLQIIEAIARQSDGSGKAVNTKRIVSAEAGSPGAGAEKEARVVVS